MVGEEADVYERQATEVYADEHWRNRTWMNVSDQRMENGKPVPYDVLTVQVDKRERVAFYGRRSGCDRTVHDMKKEAIPSSQGKGDSLFLSFT
ncbi:hypothetical protein BAG01nite_15020 [Brevibacillus agri]|uniref:Uncharacterized protein n=2 Tax=Brevibacillus agri TaxID=51101 RepID=A0ABQ0SNG4_9BACL|nr:hypothetical protein PMI08_03874 [Brevibacillus sp. CF112]GED25400.1 hypothetical protein BAG01nite_15020 [Brevibacillus agri]